MGRLGLVAKVFLFTGPGVAFTQKVGFRVTVGGELQKSKKGERSTSQL